MAMTRHPRLPAPVPDATVVSTAPPSEKLPTKLVYGDESLVHSCTCPLDMAEGERLIIGTKLPSHEHSFRMCFEAAKLRPEPCHAG